jgi:hypothetical protein
VLYQDDDHSGPLPARTQVAAWSPHPIRAFLFPKLLIILVLQTLRQSRAARRRDSVFPELAELETPVAAG